MKNVIFIINSLQLGGAERQLLELAKRLKSYDLSLTVFSILPGGELKNDLVQMGVHVVEFEFNRKLLFWGQFWRMVKLIRKIKPTAVHTWMYHSNLIGGIIAKFGGCSNIIWSIHHNSLSIRTNKVSTVFLIFLSAFFSYLIPKRIVYVSDAAKRTHERIKYRKRSVVIPNGIDTNYFKPTNSNLFNNEVLGKSNDFYIGFFARFDPIKNWQRFLMAFKESISLCNGDNIQVKLVLAGIGMNTKNLELREYITKLGLVNHTVLLGAQKNMPEIISSVNIVANPSLKESFSLILAEAMSCNVMCISSRQGDPVNLINDAFYYFNAYDINDITNCIVRAVKFKSENHGKVIDTRRFIVGNYGMDKVVNSYMELY